MPTPRSLPFLLLAWLLMGGLSLPATAKDRSTVIASLIDPAKLATLKQRGAKPRVQKYVAQLRPKSLLALLGDADFVHDLHPLWPTLS